MTTFEFSPALFAALSQRPYPISLDISYSYRPNTDLISQLPSLMSLNVGRHPLTATAVSALGAHPALTTLELASVNANTLRDLLANPRLWSLHVSEIIGNTASAFEAIANHPHLTRIEIPVADTAAVAAIAHNVNLRAIKLHPEVDAIAAIPLLAALPQLESLSIYSMGAVFPAPLKAEHLSAFSAKPLKQLSVTLLAMDHPTLSTLVALPANKLVFWGGAPFDHEHIARLNSNAALTSLAIEGGIDETLATALLRGLHPNLTELSFRVVIECPEDWSLQRQAEVIVENTLTAQWVAAGKSAENLSLTVQTLR